MSLDFTNLDIIYAEDDETFQELAVPGLCRLGIPEVIIRVYVCMYVYLSLYICMCVCIHIYIYVYVLYIYIYIHISLSLYIYIHTYYSFIVINND